MVPRGTDPVAVAATVAAWPHVELAYVEGGPVPPPVNPADDPLAADQGYLSAAPVGIDAPLPGPMPMGAALASLI